MHEELKRALDRLMDGIRADWALYIKYTGTGEAISVKADALMDTMSTIKIPVLVTLYRLVDAGLLDLARTFTLDTRFKRFGTGVLQYMDDGMVFSLRDAATLMIIESDNTATDYCYQAVGGPDAVNATMRELGFSDIIALGNCHDWFSALAGAVDASLGDLCPAELFRAGYPDLAPAEWLGACDRFHFDAGRPFSQASPRALGRLLEMIWNDSCASPAACAEMRRHLAQSDIALAPAEILAGGESRA